MNSSFLKSIFSEPDGTGSSTRITMLAIICFILGIGSTLAFKMHDHISVGDMNSFLSSSGNFILTTCGPLYAINKGSDAIKNKNQTGV